MTISRPCWHFGQGQLGAVAAGLRGDAVASEFASLAVPSSLLFSLLNAALIASSRCRRQRLARMP